MTARRASVLVVDDNRDNLLAVAAILEPLGHELVTAQSGEDALRELLHRDFAAILLDVRMPGLDGFQTAELIKQRERTRYVPIIFLTAHGNDAQNVFRAYSAGGVDYLLKPFDPDVLRSKVSVLTELWEKTERLREQEEELRHRERAELERASEQRYRSLADAMPQIVWEATLDGHAFYYNERWFEYTGIDPAESSGSDWQRVVHPDDLPATLTRWEAAVATGEVFEVEYRFRGADGAFRWHLGRAVPVRGADGVVTSWVGTATDIHDHKRTEEGQGFLLEAGALLATSLDYEATLARLAEAAVPAIADWCVVHVLDDDGAVRQLAIAHADPRKVQIVRELQERYPPDPDAPQGAARVVRTGQPELIAEITDELLVAAARDELHLELLRELRLGSYMCAPLVARERILGAIAFVHAESERRYDERDLAVAEELARRAAMAVDNAQLYREAEEQAQAARVLATVGDGVFLVDRHGVVRLWNPAAEAITGLPPREVVGRRARDVLPQWEELEPVIPRAGAPGAAPARAESLLIDIRGRELWLSISGVGFDDGTVYAFRDLTEERVLEQMRSEFVATVSHELRTPLAAIHGSALTLLRPDLDLDDAVRDRLLEVIGEESSRLATIVNDLLLASHLDSGRLRVAIESCDAVDLAQSVIAAARTHLPDGITLELNAPDDLPHVAADPGQLHQVLANLVDNAIKYSPDGGPVEVTLEPHDSQLRFAVRDRGLGIPRGERRRVFEKFYRLDPNMTRGIGGTGLGLYICRELVRMMNGRIWVESGENEGSTFLVEIPLADPDLRAAAQARRRAAASA